MTWTLAVALVLGSVAAVWLRVYSLLFIVPTYFVASILCLSYFGYSIASAALASAFAAGALQIGYLVGSLIVARTARCSCRSAKRSDGE